MVEAFIDDDDGYLRWIALHSHGFVLNTNRPPGADYFVVHTSRCATITGRPARGERWTDQYIKVCADDRGEIAAWIRREVGTDAGRDCQFCLR